MFVSKNKITDLYDLNFTTKLITSIQKANIVRFPAWYGSFCWRVNLKMFNVKVLTEKNWNFRWKLCFRFHFIHFLPLYSLFWALLCRNLHFKTSTLLQHLWARLRAYP